MLIRDPQGAFTPQALLCTDPSADPTQILEMTPRTAAWYQQPSPTFVDAIALVRRHLWLASEGFSRSPGDPDIQELPTALYHRLVDSLTYAA